MTPLEFKEEHITPKTLSQQLGIPVPEILKELAAAQEVGLFQDHIEERTILHWGVVARTCQKHGFTAVDKFIEEPSVKITPEEQTVLKEAARFHRDYGKMVHEISSRVDPASAEALLKYHTDTSKSIEAVLERSKPKKREQAGPEMA